MINPAKVLKESILSEKATRLSSHINQYTFEVYPDADRKEVAEAVEQLYKVKVARVNILNSKPLIKLNRTNRKRVAKHAAKKAIVTLKQGDTIEMQ
ncbi:MAG: 50S ribosomal protein L23 [Verrucomicrobia bacterium ADurb.Bin474]|nr:MAG: 50S ribosomal protein L23 [Verrucomicrobia bacterium ADurb.Bin474]